MKKDPCIGKKRAKKLTEEEREAIIKEHNRKQYATAWSEYVHKQAEMRLNRMLEDPERSEQEKAFELEHENDTDEELFQFFKAQKRKRGKAMKPYNTIGYTYIIKRFGHWSDMMGRINSELAAEKRAAAAAAAVAAAEDKNEEIA